MVDEFTSYLDDNRLDALLIFSRTPNFRYVTGLEMDGAVAIVSRKEKIIFANPLYRPTIPGFKTVYWKAFGADLRGLLRKQGVATVGIDSDEILLKEKRLISGIKTADASDFLGALRSVKSKDEVDMIQTACRMTDKVFGEIVSDFHFRTEEEISRFIKTRFVESGFDIAFEPIVASGINATIAHHNQLTRLNKGFLVLDFGAKYKGYCADMTRTVFLGRARLPERAIYEKIFSVQDACIEKAHVGMRASDLYIYAKELMGPDVEFFNHGISHGLGIEVHERPSFRQKSLDVLREGNVFTVEPGYYNAKRKIGIRIEDDVHLGKKKKILTKSTKELIELKA